MYIWYLGDDSVVGVPYATGGEGGGRQAPVHQLLHDQTTQLQHRRSAATDKTRQRVRPMPTL
jgi:hypothetical protein